MSGVAKKANLHQIDAHTASGDLISKLGFPLVSFTSIKGCLKYIF